MAGKNELNLYFMEEKMGQTIPYVDSCRRALKQCGQFFLLDFLLLRKIVFPHIQDCPRKGQHSAYK